MKEIEQMESIGKKRKVPELEEDEISFPLSSVKKMKKSFNNDFEERGKGKLIKTKRDFDHFKKWILSENLIK